MKNKIFSFLMLFAAGLLMMAFAVSEQQSKPWTVPDKYQKMKNPVKFDKKLATSVWTKHCKSCHGKVGLGDGAKAATLDTSPGDFSTKEFQKQSDGALFYKTRFGRDEMPNFEKKIPEEEDIWQVVHLMKTMGG